MKAVKAIGRILKGVYDILASYLLAWVVFFATLAFVFHLGLSLAAQAAGYESATVLYDLMDAKMGPWGIGMRLVGFFLLHAGVVWLFQTPIFWLKDKIEAAADAIITWINRATRENEGVGLAIEGIFSIVVTGLLIPFVLQPTMVDGYTTSHSWAQRATNLLDGTASTYLADSVVGLYRKAYADPIESHGGVTADQVAENERVDIEEPDPGEAAMAPPPAASGEQPLMDRWDPLVWEIAEQDPDRFAKVKAFMWVESAGRQFAVSRTGCSGLMQFCAGTARSRPYRRVFGTGQVYVCKCDGHCKVPREASRALETGSSEGMQRAVTSFPCDMTDARFHPRRSLKAGRLYIDRLDERYDGNLYLMYVGYNSGPAVADKLFRAVERNGQATLDELEPHMADAMRPFYGAGCERRARSLANIHLPKIKRAYERYRSDARASTKMTMLKR
ncbi:MAG: transglycosylase SLT domain-containing protein [Myxococcota bacterium]